MSLLEVKPFDILYLLVDLGEEFPKRASGVQRAVEKSMSRLRVRQVPMELVSVTDYTEIFRLTNDACQRIQKNEGREGIQYFVYLSPGTPQMQTVWVLLVQSGLFPARMIDATPRDLLAPGAPIWREVDLSLPTFPQVVSPGETARIVGILEAQKNNLTAENQRLQAELDLCRAGAHRMSQSTIPNGFDLRIFLSAQERALYVKAMEEAEGNAARAARLLGIDPHAFRKRAASLGLRPRQRT